MKVGDTEFVCQLEIKRRLINYFERVGVKEECQEKNGRRRRRQFHEKFRHLSL